MHTDQDHFDVVVIGGSYAGLSASLQLARARRKLLVIDAGSPRNRVAKSSHGFLAQDGRPPAEISADARAQLLMYPTVRWTSGRATDARHTADGFSIVLDDQQTLTASRVVIATGVVDELPPIEGLAERWGASIFHCPYCHGYELQQGAIGVIASNPAALHQAMLLPDWGDVTLFTNDALTLDAEASAELLARGVTIEPARIVRVVDKATVELAGGRRIPFAGLFTAPRTRQASAIAEQLDCAFEEGPQGPFIRTDGTKATTVPGVFACGDAARGAGNVAMAVGDGAQAGVSAHRSMIFAAR